MSSATFMADASRRTMTSAKSFPLRKKCVVSFAAHAKSIRIDGALDMELPSKCWQVSRTASQRCCT
jgi:hypothetical protein